VTARLVPVLGWLYLHFVGLTSRVRFHCHPDAKPFVEGNAPCIHAFWHRYQLMMCFTRRNRGIRVLVSRSGDGELIARALELFGYETARGSSSRGGAAALKAMLEAVAGGASLGVTPDGPRGPYRSLQPGTAAMAQKTGAPILPCGWAGSRVKELRSWDRFLIPLPFGRYEVVFGAPLRLASDEPDAEGRIRAALDAAPAEADRLLAEALR
jgi:lysophospholipid acyltransferase (LPLAT)-like uncharacterized protein